MNKEMTEKVLTYRWIIFIILALAYFFVYFHRLSLPVVANDISEEFAVNASILGLLGSLYFYCYAAMQFPAGLLSDSLGPRKTVTFFLVIASLGSLLFGLASNIGLAFVGRILVGFGVSMVFIPTMKILSQWFRADEFAFMAGILNAVGGAGVLAATWLLALMTEIYGWRFSFELIGVCTIVVAVFVWIMVRDRPEDKGWPSVINSDTNVKSAEGGTKKLTLAQGARKVISEKYFWPVAIWFFFDCGIFFGFGALWGGPYLMHTYHLTKSETGVILSMIAWGMIIGSPLLGFMSDKVLKSRKKPLIFCAGILVIDMAFLYLYPASLSRFILFIVFFIFAVCSSSVVVLGFTTTKELFPVEIAGTSVGTVNLFPFLGGAVFMPFLGKILDYYPETPTGEYSMDAYSAVLLVLLISSVITLLCTFLMKETFPGKSSV